ncbi:hypothetical protein PLESTF_001250700 [Pleodorina starrii]|nr:hypothetical protein PLESTF_001250700 [Pleodorina starrii]
MGDSARATSQAAARPSYASAEDGFDDRDANVACRQLGFAGGRAHWGAYFGEGIGPIHLKGAAADQPVKLVDGPSPAQGRLEMRGYEGRWGAACDRGWRPENTAMVCRQLGFTTNLAAAAAIGGSMFGAGDGLILMDRLTCTGFERYLAACRFDGWGVTDCDPATQTVAIDCLGTLTPTPLPGASPPPRAAPEIPPPPPPPTPLPAPPPPRIPHTPQLPSLAPVEAEEPDSPSLPPWPPCLSSSGSQINGPPPDETGSWGPCLPPSPLPASPSPSPPPAYGPPSNWDPPSLRPASLSYPPPPPPRGLQPDDMDPPSMNPYPSPDAPPSPPPPPRGLQPDDMDPPSMNPYPPPDAPPSPPPPRGLQPDDMDPPSMNPYPPPDAPPSPPPPRGLQPNDMDPPSFSPDPPPSYPPSPPPPLGWQPVDPGPFPPPPRRLQPNDLEPVTLSTDPPPPLPPPPPPPRFQPDEMEPVTLIPEPTLSPPPSLPEQPPPGSPWPAPSPAASPKQPPRTPRTTLPRPPPSPKPPPSPRLRPPPRPLASPRPPPSPRPPRPPPFPKPPPKPRPPPPPRTPLLPPPSPKPPSPLSPPAKPPSPPPPSPRPPSPPPPSPRPPSPPPPSPRPPSPPPPSPRPPSPPPPSPRPPSPPPPSPRPPSPRPAAPTYEPSNRTYHKAGTVGELSPMPLSGALGRVFLRLLCPRQQYATSLLVGSAVDATSWKLRCRTYMPLAPRPRRLLYLQQRADCDTHTVPLDEGGGGGGVGRRRLLQDYGPVTEVNAGVVDFLGFPVQFRPVLLGMPGSPEEAAAAVVPRSASPSSVMSCPTGFEALRAETDGVQWPPTQMAIGCGDGNWTAPSLGLGSYGPRVEPQALQCPGGMLAAGVVAATRSLVASVGESVPVPPVVIEAVTLYCARRL